MSFSVGSTHSHVAHNEKHQAVNNTEKRITIKSERNNRFFTLGSLVFNTQQAFLYCHFDVGYYRLIYLLLRNYANVNAVWVCIMKLFVNLLNCDDCSVDGHFLLAALWPPEESHKAVARVHLYREPSDRKRRRARRVPRPGWGCARTLM